MSGTHCSGKSTLIDAFLRARPGYAHEPEPHEWLEAHGEPFADEPDAAAFHRQLEVSVERLAGYPRGSRVVFERSPLDFLAYLLALEDLGRAGRDCELTATAIELVAAGLQHLELLVILPLDESTAGVAPAAEDLELRSAMNDRLMEIIATDPYSLFDREGPRILEVRGTPAQRVAVLQRAVALADKSASHGPATCA